MADTTPSAIPGLGDSSSIASDINEPGQVVGYTTTAEGQPGHAFFWSPGDDEATDLGTLSGYTSSLAAAANDVGLVVGYNSDDSGGARAFVWTEANGMEGIPSPEPGFSTYGQAVNITGQVLVNAANDTSGRMYVRQPGDGHLTPLDDGNGNRAGGTAINAVGQVAGTVMDVPDPEGGQVASELAYFWYADGRAKQIGALGDGSDGFSRAWDLNDSGTVVGQSDTDSGNTHAFAWTPPADADDPGTMRDLGTLGGQSSRALAVNDLGAVVGGAALESGGGRAFIWTEGGGMRSLGSLGGGYSNASAISDGADPTVVGSSRTADGEDHGFFWTSETGMVDLGPVEPGSAGVVDVNTSGKATGTSTAAATGQRTATLWDTADSAEQPTTPGAPRGVVAAAGDGIANVAWAPPARNGHVDIDTYTVTASPGGVAKTVEATTDGSPNSTVFSGLANGTAYTFTVRAKNALGSPDGEGPASAPSSPVTPQAGASEPVAASGTVTSSGGNVNTGYGETTPERPVTTAVDVPPGTAGGDVNITQGVRDNAPPTGFGFLGQQVNITAPAATAEHPLHLSFRVDASVLNGVAPSALQIFRTEGAGSPVQVPDCANQNGTAAPDPCVNNRYDPQDGDAQIDVLTSRASEWNFARKTTSPPVTYPFRGFLSPYQNPPKVNVVKAGATLPLKFSLAGNRGLGIVASGFPKSAKVSCSKPVTIIGSASTTSGGLSYTKKTDVYTYSWKSAKSYAGTCRGVQVKLKDGTEHNLLFRFTK